MTEASLGKVPDFAPLHSLPNVHEILGVNGAVGWVFGTAAPVPDSGACRLCVFRQVDGIDWRSEFRDDLIDKALDEALERVNATRMFTCSTDEEAGTRVWHTPGFFPRQGFRVYALPPQSTDADGKLAFPWVVYPRVEDTTDSLLKQVLDQSNAAEDSRFTADSSELEARVRDSKGATGFHAFASEEEAEAAAKEALMGDLEDDAPMKDPLCSDDKDLRAFQLLWRNSPSVVVVFVALPEPIAAPQSGQPVHGAFTIVGPFLTEAETRDAIIKIRDAFPRIGVGANQLWHMSPLAIDLDPVSNHMIIGNSSLRQMMPGTRSEWDRAQAGAPAEIKLDSVTFGDGGKVTEVE